MQHGVEEARCALVGEDDAGSSEAQHGPPFEAGVAGDRDVELVLPPPALERGRRVCLGPELPVQVAVVVEGGHKLHVVVDVVDDHDVVLVTVNDLAVHVLAVEVAEPVHADGPLGRIVEVSSDQRVERIPVLALLQSLDRGGVDLAGHGVARDEVRGEVADLFLDALAHEGVGLVLVVHAVGPVHRAVVDIGVGRGWELDHNRGEAVVLRGVDDRQDVLNADERVAELVDDDADDGLGGAPASPSLFAPSPLFALSLSLSCLVSVSR